MFITTVMAKHITDGVLSRLALLNFKDMTPDKLGRIKGDFATLIWQYVRFNDFYRSDYERLVRSRQQAPNKEDELLEEFKDRWAISHLLEYDRVIPPKSFYFNANTVQFFKDKKTLSHWIGFRTPTGKNHSYLIAIIDLDKDPAMTLKLIERQIASNKSFKRFKGSSSKSFGDNFVCFYLSTVKEMQPKDVINKYGKICGGSLQNNSLKRKVKSFIKLSTSAPHIFFNARK